MDSAIPTGVWPYITGALVALLLCFILFSVITQFRMDRPRQRPWPDGMEPPDEHFSPVHGELYGCENLEDVIYSAASITIDEQAIRKRLDLPWYVPYKTPPKQGRAWLGRTSFVFYYRYTDDFFHLPYPSITMIDAFHGLYRGNDFRTKPALIIHYVSGGSMFCVIQIEEDKMDSLARALARRVEQATAADSELTGSKQQGGHPS